MADCKIVSVNNTKVSFEFIIELNNIRYDIIFGTRENGYWCYSPMTFKGSPMENPYQTEVNKLYLQKLFGISEEDSDVIAESILELFISNKNSNNSNNTKLCYQSHFDDDDDFDAVHDEYLIF